METFGTALRRLRGDLSVRALAKRANCSASYISALEFDKSTPSRSMATSLDQALAANGQLIKVLQEVENASNRREALGLIGSSLSTVLQPDLRNIIDRRLVLAHQETAETLASMYRSGDPRVGLPVAINYADTVLSLLDSPMRGSERTELINVAVGIHAQVGLWACHMHQTSLAYRYLATSYQIATEADDRALLARSLGALSYLHSSAPRGGYGGRPQYALDLLDRAIGLVDQADGFTKGWLAVWRADQQATLGNVSAALADIELAGKSLDKSSSSQIQGFFSRSAYGYGMLGHLSSVRALTLALDGRHDESERAFTHVQCSAANMRRRIATYGHEALGHAKRNNPEAASEALRHSTNLAVQENYAMGISRAKGIRHGFSADWENLAFVREVDEQLRLLPN